jgi:hypothetical protein
MKTKSHIEAEADGLAELSRLDPTTPSTVKEWIDALSKLDPSLPLYSRCKYTGKTDWTKEEALNTIGLSEMEAGVGHGRYACILY